MSRFNIFEDTSAPEVMPRSPAILTRVGLQVIELANTASRRHKFGLSKDTVMSRDGSAQFPMVSWNRRLQRYGRPYGAVMKLADKREVGAGTLLTVQSQTDNPKISAVQGYVVNDRFPNIGLRRILNISAPQDAAEGITGSLLASTVVIDLERHPDESQLIDYSKAISTVLRDDNGREIV